MAYIPESKLLSLVTAKFRTNLSRQLALLSAVPSTPSLQRTTGFLKNVATVHTQQEDYNDSSKESILREMVGTSDDADSDSNDDDLLANAVSSGKVSVQRFKGLGEMMPEQLWTTTMDPERRTLLQVTMDDAAIADQTLSILMGDSVAPRKSFISTNAENLRMVDLDF